MFVSRIAPRMDRVTGANHPSAPRRPSAQRIKNVVRRVDAWTLEAFNPAHARRSR